ncbi:MAG: hypothetical protein NT022_00600 [Deltaproteobacteria bacterium]|nr:hypothetical protein [Deltaproteobacteria bacterium]
MKANEKDIQPNVLSDVLLSEYVLKKEDNQRFHLNPRWSASENFDEYVVLYKIAIVLMALLNIEGKSQKFLQVRLLFEKAVFTDGNIQKLYFYHHVKSAMDKLGELLETSNVNLDNLKDQNEKLPWTMTCLRAAGVLESNQAIKQSRPAVIGMGWAMAWLKETGNLETNPALLAQFALMWTDSYVAILDFLKEYEPR